jgi:hypothetical protein
MPRRLLPPTVLGGERVSLNWQQLDELQGVGNLPLTSAQEAELVDICTDYLIWVRFEQASSAASTASEIFDDLQCQLHDIVTSLYQLVGTQIPQHHHVHMEINDHFENVPTMRRGSRAKRAQADIRWSRAPIKERGTANVYLGIS